MFWTNNVRISVYARCALYLPVLPLVGVSKLDFVNASQIWIDKAKEQIKDEALKKDYASSDPVQYAVLCEPRWAYTEARNYQAITTAFVIGAKEVASTPSDKPGELMKNIISDWGKPIPKYFEQGQERKPSNVHGRPYRLCGHYLSRYCQCSA